MSDDRLVGHDSAAAYAGVTSATWRAYTANGTAPAPDGREPHSTLPHILRPWWHASTIDRWKAERPGKGWRAGKPGRI